MIGGNDFGFRPVGHNRHEEGAGGNPRPLEERGSRNSGGLRGALVGAAFTQGTQRSSVADSSLRVLRNSGSASFAWPPASCRLGLCPAPPFNPKEGSAFRAKYLVIMDAMAAGESRLYALP